MTRRPFHLLASLGRPAFSQVEMRTREKKMRCLTHKRVAELNAVLGMKKERDEIRKDRKTREHDQLRERDRTLYEPEEAGTAT